MSCCATQDAAHYFSVQTLLNWQPDIAGDILCRCVVRSLLKKIKQRVLVGDDVLVTSVDWTDGRGGSQAEHGCSNGIRPDSPQQKCLRRSHLAASFRRDNAPITLGQLHHAHLRLHS